jgi:hypothetical protein
MLLYCVYLLESGFFFFFDDFSQPGDKKKGLANPTKGFLRFKKNIRLILTQKTLEVAIYC